MSCDVVGHALADYSAVSDLFEGAAPSVIWQKLWVRDPQLANPISKPLSGLSISRLLYVQRIALFVVLHNRKWIHEIVRLGDAVGDGERILPDSEFDLVVRRHKMQSLPRAVAVELASLDGAVVLANSGEILAYGAVLQPKRRGFIRGSEGSRTKAAIGASTYGLAIKISSDGDITTYFDGREFFRI
jgi:DisA bacterial checkpoint controller nucleotide-binding